MTTVKSLYTVISLAFALLAGTGSPTSVEAGPLHDSRTMAKIHIPFIANEGQSDKRVKFYAPTFGGTVFITNDGEIVYSLSKIETAKINRRFTPNSTIPNPHFAKGLALKEEILDGKVTEINGEGKAITKVSYFKGNDSSKWKSNISTYDLVSLGEIYEGVQLKLKAYGRNVEKLFHVKHGTDPERIRVKVSGGKLSVNKQGELEVGTELGVIKFTKPTAYQEGGGKKELVEAAYVVKGDEYRFKLGKYDTGKDLVIDPLLGSTFLGGGSFDRINSMTVDSAGNVYVAGETFSSDFIPQTMPPIPGVDPSLDGDSDAFVSKFSRDLTSLVASTFLGGSNDAVLDRDLIATGFAGDRAYSVVVSGGSVYVTGETTSPNFPIRPTSGTPAYDPILDGGSDVFVSRLNTDLSVLSASTFLGGNRYDGAFSIALGLDGSVYVAGVTRPALLNSFHVGLDPPNPADFLSNTFPTTPAAYDTSFNGGQDAFVSRLNPDLTLLMASTFLGGGFLGQDLGDRANSLAIGPDRSVYVTGGTISENFPTTAGAVDRNCGSDGKCNTFQGPARGLIFVAPDPFVSKDVFVSMLDDNLTMLRASTYLGGSGTNGHPQTGAEYARSIVLLGGNVYVAGTTDSPNFIPAGTSGFDTSYNGGGTDAFVTMLDANLTTLRGSTFLGAGGGDTANSIAVDQDRNVYVAGDSETLVDPQQFSSQAFASQLDESVTTLRGSLSLGDLGGSAAALSIALGPDRNVYGAGATSSPDFIPPGMGRFDPSFNGVTDAFVSVFNFDSGVDLSVSKVGPPGPVPAGSPLTYTVTVTNTSPTNSGSGVILTDTLSGATFATPLPSNCSPSGNVLTCNLGNLAPRASGTVIINVTTALAGTITNTASVQGNDSDPVPNNNRATVTTVVSLAADLSITKSGPTTILLGDNLTYTVTVSNNGPSSATGVILTDTLTGDTGATFVAPLPNNCTQSGKVLTCGLSLRTGAMAPPVNINIVVRPTTVGTITNIANVMGEQTDIAMADNRSTVDTRVDPNPALICFGAIATIVGTLRADTLTGTPGPDTIRGLDGDDTINGLDGNDRLCGNFGNDALDGGAGNNSCDGGSGTDTAVRCATQVGFP